MEEIQEKDTLTEPVSDNSSDVSQQQEGQAENAPSELILGKFKSVDELMKAYEKLEKFQGLQSHELGKLRQNSSMLDNITKAWTERDKIFNAKEAIEAAANKYNTWSIFKTRCFEKFTKKLTKPLEQILMQISLSV